MLFPWFCCGLLVTGFIYNFILLEKVEKFSPYAQLYIGQESSRLNGESASELLSKNEQLERSYSLVIWTKKLNESLTVKEINKSVEADIFALQGNSQILFPDTLGLQNDNKTSCLISLGLANKTFGNSDVKGLSIVYNKKIYTVLGVVSSKESFFVYETDDKNVLGLNHITFLNKADTNKVLLKQAVNERFSVDSELLDYDIYRVFFAVITAILLFVLSAFFIFKSVKIIVRNIHERKQITKEKFVFLNMLVFSSALIFFIKKLQISSEYLPTQVSDFEFIKKLMDYSIENTQLLLQTEKYVGEFQQIQNLFALVLVTLLLFIGSLA